MNCENDEALLLLAHDQVGLRDKVTMLWHLRRCTACRERYQRLHHVSRVLMNASALSGDTPRINRLLSDPHTLSPGLTLLLITVLLLVTTAAVTFVYRQNTATTDHCRFTPSSSPIPGKPTPCASHLGNDRYHRLP